jgi:hypothetical protein
LPRACGRLGAGAAPRPPHSAPLPPCSGRRHRASATFVYRASLPRPRIAAGHPCPARSARCCGRRRSPVLLPGVGIPAASGVACRASVPGCHWHRSCVGPSVASRFAPHICVAFATSPQAARLRAGLRPVRPSGREPGLRPGAGLRPAAGLRPGTERPLIVKGLLPKIRIPIFAASRPVTINGRPVQDLRSSLQMQSQIQHGRSMILQNRKKSPNGRCCILPKKQVK